MTDEKEPSRGKGCLFYGLITAALIFIGVLTGIYFGTRKAMRYALDTYTTNAPSTIPAVQLQPAEQRNIANDLLKQFEAHANSATPEDLVLDEQQLNVLISQPAEMRAYKGHLYLQPQGEELKAFVSLPLDQFKQWQEFAQKIGGTNYAGRYLNGLAYVNLVVTNGVLAVVPRKVVVSAKSLPDQFLKQFPWSAITQPINGNQNFRSALQRVEAITVQDSQVRVKFRH
jgi:hypothetical protein